MIILEENTPILSIWQYAIRMYKAEIPVPITCDWLPPMSTTHKETSCSFPGRTVLTITGAAPGLSNTQAQEPVGLSSRKENPHLHGISQSQCMSTQFVNASRETPMLLPPDLREWMSENSMLHFILETVEALDIQRFSVNGQGSCYPQYPTAMMLSFLIYF